MDHTHASAHHPKTLGKVEACNKNIKYELLKQQYFSTAQEARSAVKKWVDNYNYQRTHQGWRFTGAGRGDRIPSAKAQRPVLSV
ncbi:integrase core domain-containing protein [Desulfobacula sp.]